MIRTLHKDSQQYYLSPKIRSSGLHDGEKIKDYQFRISFEGEKLTLWFDLNFKDVKKTYNVSYTHSLLKKDLLKLINKDETLYFRSKIP